MSKPSILPFVLVVSIPIGLFLSGIVLVVVLSVAVWDEVQTQNFLSRIQLPFGQSLAAWRLNQVRPEAERLVMELNTSVQIESNQAEAERVLRKLILLTGEDFGTGFKGDDAKFTWKAPDGEEEWTAMLTRVNIWAQENLGIELGPVYFRGGDEDAEGRGDYVPPSNDANEPEPTYEPPENYEPPSYSPRPEPEPPPESYDDGGVVDPGYNDHDGFQPEGD